MAGKKELMRSIATERMIILFRLSKEAMQKDREIARSYIKLLYKMSSHYKIGVPRDIGRLTCKKCMDVLVPGISCKVVVASSAGYVIYRCNGCGREKHLYYKNRLAAAPKIKDA